jgi:hypothetical protein
MIIRNEELRLKYANAQWYSVFTLLRGMDSDIKCTNNQVSQAKNPLKCQLGRTKSTTALLRPMMAIEPLSW